MTTTSFVSLVNSLDGCRVVYENGNGFILEGSGGGTQKHLYRMWHEDVVDAAESDVRAVLAGGRPAVIMQKTTRICGYYANLRNWNASKLAELRDRQKGNYAIPD